MIQLLLLNKKNLHLMARRCSFPEAWLEYWAILFSMHKKGNVRVRTLWLRIILNNILWHVKATLLSFTSSLFIVWAFMSCVLELDPNPGCHTQNHMVHLFLWEHGGILHTKIFLLPQNQNTHIQWKGKKMWHSCPLWRRAVLFTFQGGTGQSIARATRKTLNIIFSV